MTAYDLSGYDASVLVEDRTVADYYERAVAAAGETLSPKLVANWVTGEFFRLMNEADVDIADMKVSPEHLAALIGMIDAGLINQTAAKKAFGVMWETGRSPQEIVEDIGLKQVSDAGELTAIVDRVLADNPDAVDSFRAGKETAIRFLIGQVMKATRGKANPQLAEQLLRDQMQAGD
jgi:aspartyl-tRNA(Asn)/glutamyl-tRNA(Gln) amidotransferase subunit B